LGCRDPQQLVKLLRRRQLFTFRLAITRPTQITCTYLQGFHLIKMSPYNDLAARGFPCAGTSPCGDFAVQASRRAGISSCGDLAARGCHDTRISFCDVVTEPLFSQKHKPTVLHRLAHDRFADDFPCLIKSVDSGHADPLSRLAQNLRHGLSVDALSLVDGVGDQVDRVISLRCPRARWDTKSGLEVA